MQARYVVVLGGCHVVGPFASLGDAREYAISNSGVFPAIIMTLHDCMFAKPSVHCVASPSDDGLLGPVLRAIDREIGGYHD